LGLEAVYELLDLPWPTQEQIDAKKAKVEKYLGVSKAEGVYAPQSERIEETREYVVHLSGLMSLMPCEKGMLEDLDLPAEVVKVETQNKYHPTENPFRENVSVFVTFRGTEKEIATSDEKAKRRFSGRS
jgi:hypothetical protein